MKYNVQCRMYFNYIRVIAFISVDCRNTGCDRGYVCLLRYSRYQCVRKLSQMDFIFLFDNCVLQGCNYLLLCVIETKLSKNSQFSNENNSNEITYPCNLNICLLAGFLLITHLGETDCSVEARTYCCTKYIVDVK